MSSEKVFIINYTILLWKFVNATEHWVSTKREEKVFGGKKNNWKVLNGCVSHSYKNEKHEWRKIEAVTNWQTNAFDYCKFCPAKEQVKEKVSVRVVVWKILYPFFGKFVIEFNPEFGELERKIFKISQK